MEIFRRIKLAISVLKYGEPTIRIRWATDDSTKGTSHIERYEFIVASSVTYYLFFITGLVKLPLPQLWIGGLLSAIIAIALGVTLYFIAWCFDYLFRAWGILD